MKFIKNKTKRQRTAMKYFKETKKIDNLNYKLLMQVIITT